MKFIFTFLRESKTLVVASIIAAFLSGVTSTAVIVLIQALLEGEATSSRELNILTFAGLCVLVILFQAISEYVLLRLSEGAVYDLRLKMSRRILATPLRKLEELGANRVLATITGDVMNVAQAVTLSPLLCMNLAIIFACLGYLAWLNWQIFIGFIIVFGISLKLYQLMANRGETFIARARDDIDTVFTALRGLAEGTKELKLSRDRREAFLEQLLEVPAQKVRRQNLSGYMHYRFAGIFGRMIFLIIFGLLLFLVPIVMPVEMSVINGYILTLLYMNMPLTGLLNVLPTLGAARVAQRKIEKLGLSLKEKEEPLAVGALPPAKDWESIELRGVTHTYYRESEDDSFTLGPVDFKIEPGELVFWVGGNGSGKTTLAKLLVGLYSPEDGEIRLNGEKVTDENLEYYRQHFAMVFSDFFIFEKLLGVSSSGLDERATAYIEKLHLGYKLKVRDGEFSTVDLSQGQRKRLALLSAYLEDKPVYVFDEWAADQDPVFKEIFYNELLAELKARGKAIVVISHDDHYFDVADRVVKLNYGQVEAYTDPERDRDLSVSLQ